jgi:hypothetical protein
MIKLKQLIDESLDERGMGMGYGSLTSNDNQLRPIPGGWNDDVDDWDGIIKGENWWAYIASNDWQKKMSEASIYINENDKPYKFHIKIKTHGLKKPTDTNESFKEKVRKHTKKVTREWINAAKKLHETELNEVGNEISKSWKECFENSISFIEKSIYEWNGKEIDPVNFTYSK